MAAELERLAPSAPIPSAGLIIFERTQFHEVDVRRAVFDVMRVSGSVFERCDFRGLALDRRYQPIFSGRPRNVFRECRFDAADLRQVRPGQARFEACSFAGANLDGWVAGTAEFVDCTFAGRLCGARFYGRPWGADAEAVDPPRGLNEFRGNDFTACELLDVSFLMGIDIAAQRWPTGEQYVRLDRIQKRITRAHAEILRWGDLRARREALAMVRAVSELSVIQKEVFLRRGEPRWQAPPDVEDRVWELLQRALP